MSMSTLVTLSEDQEKAAESFYNFLISPTEQVFILEGSAGTGKSTLVKTLLANLSQYMATVKLLNPSAFEYTVALTATTNKAAEALANISGMEVSTIHSFLGLRVVKDYTTNKTNLVPSGKEGPKYGHLIFIDECSYIDSALLGMIFKQVENCKIVFIGDRYQLSPVMASNVPVFDAGFPTATLTKVMRQMVNGVPLANPITDLAQQFKETVRTGIWTPFKPDGQFVLHVDRNTFDDMVLQEFLRPDWEYNDSKYLAWTNKRVIDYNHAISNHRSGSPKFREGDYAICNKHVTKNKTSLKTDELVQITSISPGDDLNTPGSWVVINNGATFFFPESLEHRRAAVDYAKATADEDNFHNEKALERIDNWIDLRQAFGQTINKSQGSTYNRVFIDITDVGRCTSGDAIARMMYVGVSRARHQVIMTGDFG